MTTAHANSSAKAIDRATDRDINTVSGAARFTADAVGPVATIGIVDV